MSLLFKTTDQGIRLTEWLGLLLEEDPWEIVDINGWMAVGLEITRSANADSIGGWNVFDSCELSDSRNVSCDFLLDLVARSFAVVCGRGRRHRCLSPLTSASLFSCRCTPTSVQLRTLQLPRLSVLWCTGSCFELHQSLSTEVNCHETNLG